MTAKVLVIGGTRGVGQLIAQRLVERGDAVRILARHPAAAAARLGGAYDIVAGDLTRPETLPPALDGVSHIILTAGVPSGRYAPEPLVKATDHDGVLATIAAALEAGLPGRFVYLNAQGRPTQSLSGFLINLIKRNTLVWRRAVEDAIRRSGLDYAIIRVPFLTDGPGGGHAIAVSQGALPLSPLRRMARADVAEAFVAAMDHPAASRATFEITAGRGSPGGLAASLAALRPDP